VVFFFANFLEAMTKRRIWFRGMAGNPQSVRTIGVEIFASFLMFPYSKNNSTEASESNCSVALRASIGKEPT